MPHDKETNELINKLVTEADELRKNATSAELDQLAADTKDLSNRMLYEQEGYIDGEDKPKLLENNKKK